MRLGSLGKKKGFLFPLDFAFFLQRFLRFTVTPPPKPPGVSLSLSVSRYMRDGVMFWADVLADSLLSVARSLSLSFRLLPSIHPPILRTALSLCCTTTTRCVSQRHCGPVLLSFVTGWLQSHCGGPNFNETAGQAKPDKSQISLSLPTSALLPGARRNLLVQMRISSCSLFFPQI